MRSIDLMYGAMFAELAQRTLDARFTSDFPLSGRFVAVTVKQREYWYFDEPTDSGTRRRYVGPKADDEMTRRVAAFRDLKDDLKARRKLVSTLTRDAGLVAPDRFTGDVIEALAHAGLFRLRAVLIGTVAFQCYAGVLGVRLPGALMQTGDADFAQDFAISAEVGDTLPPVLDILRAVDPTFRAIPHAGDRARVTAFENAMRFRVEFLTGNRGSDDNTGKPSTMPALGGASAENLRFLDYLIYEPIRTVLLHKSGVSVLAPAPERYALHKLIVATRRRLDVGGVAKRDKDVMQAAILIEAMVQTRRQADLADGYGEAWRRGPAWQEAIRAGMGMLPLASKDVLIEALREGMNDIGEAPDEFGL